MLFLTLGLPLWACQLALVVKNPPAKAGDVGDAGLIPGLERSRGGGNSNPLQYSCLENLVDRGACPPFPLATQHAHPIQQFLFSEWVSN